MVIQKKDSKNIAFFVTSLNSGGLENYLLRFLSFTSGKIQAVVFCKSSYEGELLDKYIEIPDVKVVKLKLSFLNLFNYIKLFHYLKSNKVDAICDFTGNFAGLVNLTGYLAGIKIRIAFYRGSTNHFRETTFRLLYNRFANSLVRIYSTMILSNSQTALNFFFQADSLKKIPHKVIYNGINAKDFEVKVDKEQIRKTIGIPSGSFIIGHTGRLNEAKNHQLIINVAKILCKKYNNIYFVLAGKDTEHFVSSIISENADLKNNVIGLGYRNDVNELLQSFDLYIFPSLTEGQPNSLIEAMVSGLPIIASDINPIKETVPHFFHSKLLDPSDFEGFAANIEKLYTDPLEREKYILKEWAIKNFDPFVLFNAFYKEFEG